VNAGVHRNLRPANKEMARELEKKIDTFLDSYYKNIALFRALFNKYKKEQDLLFLMVPTPLIFSRRPSW